MKRKSAAGVTIQRIINTPKTHLPQQRHLFIHSSQNIHKLTQFLTDYLLCRQHESSVEVDTSEEFGTIIQYKNNYGLIDDLLESSHEEADTCLLLHILSAKKAGYSRSIVDYKDTDHYQTKVWLSSLDPRPALPEFTTHGWIVDKNDIVQPILQTLPAVPDDTVILTTRKCKKGWSI